MVWDEKRSLALSKVCVFVFAVLLALADIGGYWLTTWAMSVMDGLHGGLLEGLLLMATLYSCSVPAWVLLLSLKRLLDNMGQGRVFTAENVKLLRRISFCCVAAFALCFASAFYYIPFAFIGAAAGFMALIVHIVKNCFEQAAGMKNELDFTV